MEPFDFSCKHDILIRNPDGSLQPMDEPYFEANEVAPGTWCILSDGDYSYLVEGDNEALAIDCGYGCGNIREFLQTLTKKPVRNVVDTHHHFDHTANNAYFDKVYMSEQTYPLATIPFQSFEGIYFPKDYPVEIIGEGYRFDLGNRTLEAIFVPNHAPGSLAFIDDRERILFSGDEVMNNQVRVETNVEDVRANFAHMAERRDEYDWICSGSAKKLPADQIERYVALMDRVLAGDMGEPKPLSQGPREIERSEDGRIIFDRMLPRPTDSDKKNVDPEALYHARMLWDNEIVLYFDDRKIFRDQS